MTYDVVLKDEKLNGNMKTSSKIYSIDKFNDTDRSFKHLMTNIVCVTVLSTQKRENSASILTDKKVSKGWVKIKTALNIRSVAVAEY